VVYRREIRATFCLILEAEFNRAEYDERLDIALHKLRCCKGVYLYALSAMWKVKTSAFMNKSNPILLDVF
jgi:hypothetical protein